MGHICTVRGLFLFDERLIGNDCAGLGGKENVKRRFVEIEFTVLC